MSTLFSKRLLKEAKTSGISPLQARKVQRALNIIRSTPVQELLKSSNLKKIQVPDRDDIYLYRVDMQQRIILSINKDEKIIHSIVDASGIKTNIDDWYLCFLMIQIKLVFKY